MENQNIEFKDDIVFAKFLNYMKKALYHRRVNYFKTFKRIDENEVSLTEVADNKADEISSMNNISKSEILNYREAYLLNLHYIHGLSYNEVSKITNEKIGTLKQRRNRALAKLKKKMEG